MAERRWSDQFIGMLEALRLPAQFQRGRRYHRLGQVRQLTISASLASALVLDEDGQTYRTKVAVRAFRAGEWSRIEAALAQRAIYVARLLAGQLPDDLDRMLGELGLSLFPDSLAELAMECPCPDRQVPCRHLAATCYALAQSFDEDPFGILAWRGRGRDELLELLRRRRAQRAGRSDPADQGGASFWTGGPRRAPMPRQAEASAPGAVRRAHALLDQLDALRLSAGRFEVVDLLRPAYSRLCGRSVPARIERPRYETEG